MNILQIAARMPYPLEDGGAIGIYNITKYLAAAGHTITLLTYPLNSVEETRRAVEDLSRFAEVRLVSKPLPARWRVLVRSLFRGAYPIERRMTPEMFELIRSTVAGEAFDVVHVDHAHMARYATWVREELDLPVVLREHNFESLIYERFALVEPNPLKRLIASIHGKRLRKEEWDLLGRVDAVAAITEEDASLMREAVTNGILEVIPAGVDTDYFQPQSTATDDRILMVGSLHWDPNFDAARHFIQDIYPLVKSQRPGVTLEIVGSGGDRIQRFLPVGDSGVQIHGRVNDIRDYLARSSVLVVPLRIGGGMRLKLLEFFSAGKAVVSTRIGAEGNIARDGEEVLLRDTPREFAEAVLQLLGNRELQVRLGKNARLLVQKYYAWPQIANRFVALYSAAIDRHRSNRPNSG